MNRLLLLLLLPLVLASCAPTQDFSASVLNQTFGALDLLTSVDTPEGVAVTVTPPRGIGLERIRLDFEAIGPLTVTGDACERVTESVVVCAWPVLVSPTTVTFTGADVSVMAAYRLPGESERRWEFLRY